MFFHIRMSDLGGNAGTFLSQNFTPGIVVEVKTLLTYTVSTCSAEQSFSRRHFGELCQMRGCSRYP